MSTYPNSSAPMAMAERLSSDAFLEEAVLSAVQAAVQDHKAAGNAVAGWQNGQLTILSAEEIPAFLDGRAEERQVLGPATGLSAA
jgi:hypothetical protein